MAPEEGRPVVLVKPQLEVGRDALPANAVLQDLRTFIDHETPWRTVHEMPSPIRGKKGNVEAFLHMH